MVWYGIVSSRSKTLAPAKVKYNKLRERKTRKKINKRKPKYECKIKLIRLTTCCCIKGTAAAATTTTVETKTNSSS